MLLKVCEAAIYLGVKPSWVRHKIFKKEITYLKMGRHIRFDRSELQKFIESVKVTKKERSNE